MTDQQKDFIRSGLNHINRLIDLDLPESILAEQAYNSLVQRLTKVAGVKHMAKVMSRYQELALAKCAGFCEMCHEREAKAAGVCLKCLGESDQFETMVARAINE